MTNLAEQESEGTPITYQALTTKIARRLSRSAPEEQNERNVHPLTRNGPAPCFNCGQTECEGHLKCDVRGKCTAKKVG